MTVKILATIVLFFAALISFLKNIGIYDKDAAIIGFSLVDLVALVFVLLVVWDVL